jgi:DNA-binding SARP family transcriptional activator
MHAEGNLGRLNVPIGGQLAISFLDGSVHYNGMPVRLGSRDLELIFAIARRRQTYSVGELVELLWPECELADARNSFKVQLHRLRKRLADNQAIIRDGDGLRLGTGARVDQWDIEREMPTFCMRQIESGSSRDKVFAMYERLRLPRPVRICTWNWLEPTNRRLRELAGDLAGLLAKYAIREGRPDEALELAREMLLNDECDEAAREIVINAYLARGDRAEALRQYRIYRDVLAAELACEPSEQLAALVNCR